MNNQTTKPSILIVDDTPENIDVLNGILTDDYKIKVATRGKTALKIATSTKPPDLILLDIMMPDMDGYEVCKELKKNIQSKDIPVIFVTVKDEIVDELKGLELGAVDYITKPVSPPIVKGRIHNHIELKSYRDRLEQLVLDRTKELHLTQEVTIESLGTLAEYRDPETGAHIKRTQNYVRLLAENLMDHPKFKDYLDEQTIYYLYISAPLHDIGKVGIKDSILLKPGKLTGEEWKEMKRHAIYGRDVIKKSEEKLGFKSFLKYAHEIAYTHHERYDGGGYPQGLSGNDIPISGRLMSLADVYDALISERPYKPAFSHEKALEIITIGDGRTMPHHFDPDILEVFIGLQEEFRRIGLKFTDS